MEFDVELEGTVYKFRIIWNELTSTFALMISQEDGTLIVSGIALVVDSPLIQKYANPLLPPGELFAWDSSGQGMEVQDRGDLGTRVLLIYSESS